MKVPVTYILWPPWLTICKGGAWTRSWAELPTPIVKLWGPQRELNVSYGNFDKRVGRCLARRYTYDKIIQLR